MNRIFLYNFMDENDPLYPNKVRSHLVTIAPWRRVYSKLRSALHFRYSKVITRFIAPLANTAQS